MNDLLPKWLAKTLGVLLNLFIIVLIANQIQTLRGTPQTMTISADGKVTAVPNLASVRLGVVTTGQNVIDIKNSNNAKVNQIIGFIKQQGIPEKDIQTSQFYTSPIYNYSSGQRIINGYQATQTVTIFVRSIDKSQDQLEKILDGVVNNGANQVDGIDFSIDHAEKLRQEARKQAVAKAKEKANELASYADLSVGQIINIVAAPSNNYSVTTIDYAKAADSIAPDIKPGTQDIVENVAVVFEVR